MHELTGMVYGPDFRFHPGRVRVEDGRIKEIRREERVTETTDGITGDDGIRYIIPGLVDIHFHGCMGMDFCDGTPEAIRTIAAWELSEGVTGICPATLTLPAEKLKQVLSTGAAFAGMQENMSMEAQTQDTMRNKTQPAGETMLADLIGINMEGPFISHVKKGAQNGKYILPCDVKLCRSFLETSRGLVKIIGLAPEENPDFEEYIRAVKKDVRVSLAHTNADYDTAKKAFEAGACHAVHLFNAMPEMTHREPGVVGAVRDCPHVMAELICDGNHVHPSVVRAAFDMLGDERIVLISDSLRAAGMGDGEIMLGGQKVIVKGTRATLAEGGNLAGSVSSLMNCLKTAVKEMGIPLESAVRCASYNPACAIGEQGRCGMLLPGRSADLVVLDQNLEVKMVMKKGKYLKFQDKR